LKLGVSAYKIEKVVLAYQLVGAGAGALGFAPSVTGGTTALKVLKGTQYASTGILGTSLSAYGGVKEYATSKDIPYAIGAGLGTGLGFFTGVYSKEIVEGVPKTFKAIGKLGQKEYSFVKGKKGSTQVTIQEQEMVSAIDEKGNIIRMTKAEANARGLAIVKATKESIIKALKTPIKTGKIIDIELTYAEKARRAKLLLSNLKDPTSVVARKEIFEVIEKAYGKEFVGDFLSQEYGLTNIKSAIGKIDYGRTSFIPIVSGKQLGKQEQPSMLRLETQQQQKLEVKQLPLLKYNQPQPQKYLVKQLSAQQQPQKYEQKQISLLTYKTPQQQKTIQRQTLRQRYEPKQPTREITRQVVEPKPPVIHIPLKSSGGLLRRLSKKVDEDGFEAIGFRFGKEVSLGTGTKQESAKTLSKFLEGTLGASGLLKETKTGKKIRAEETGLLRDISYRKSKISPFLVVEKKGKRLRRGGTGKAIQYFRSNKKSNLLSL